MAITFRLQVLKFVVDPMHWAYAVCGEVCVVQDGSYMLVQICEAQHPCPYGGMHANSGETATLVGVLRDHLQLSRYLVWI